MAYEIGERIKLFREDRNMSQKDFAQKIGVSNSRVSNWEQGINRPDVDLLKKICETLNDSPSELLDVHHDTEEQTEHEKQIIRRYRMKTDLQRAVNILLGLEESK